MIYNKPVCSVFTHPVGIAKGVWHSERSFLTFRAATVNHQRWRSSSNGPMWMQLMTEKMSVFTADVGHCTENWTGVRFTANAAAVSPTAVQSSDPALYGSHPLVTAY